MDLDDSTKRKYKLYESIEELNEESQVAYLEELELKSDGDRDFQEQILINRLKGNYTANDFAPSDTAGDEATHKARRDEKLMNLTTKLNLDMTEHDDTSTSDEHEETANPTVLDEDNIRALIAKMQRELQETKDRTNLELCQLTKSNELLAQRNKKLLSQPIPSNLSMMPETAWDEPEAREKLSSTKLASLSEPIDDIAKMMIELDQKLQGLTTAITAAASAAGNRTSTKKRTTSLKNKANADRAKSTRKPASDKNKNREAGPQAQVACWGCSWPGYIRPRCPDCSGNAKKEE
ncbi:unnamed protein product [Trichogramma brassicae]|uniref:Uncharacterized protein n=1 Tax=Trichogramma brassicae TaxID=86971 RepID=A0A6H5J449_9HYME|nr:unnamed protein product [Trichogramma brassicae]